MDALIKEFEPKVRQFTASGFRPARQSPTVFSVPGTDGSVQCILSPRYKDKMLYTPGFPRPIFRANPPRHRVENPGAQNQATIRFLHDLGPGECVFAERPLLFASADLNCPEYQESINKTALFPGLDHTCPEDHALALVQFYDRFYFEEAINGGSMDPKKREAYLLLRVVDGIRLSPDVIRPIDYFGPNALTAFTRPDSEGKTFKGVCETLSRVKNSCSPNTYLSFDIPSFSFKVWTVRKVREGEEMTISRVNMDKYHWYRTQQLESKYFLQCDCPACSDHEASEQRRIAAMNDPALKLPNDVDEWCADPHLPDDMYARLVDEKLRRMEEEKLEGSEFYLQALTYSIRSHLALGQLAEAKEVQRRIIGLSHEFLTREETETGKVEFVKNLCERRDLTTFPIWRARIEERNPSNPNPRTASFFPTVLCPHQTELMERLWACPLTRRRRCFANLVCDRDLGTLDKLRMSAGNSS